MQRSEITATEAVRTFSELLNGIRYRGDQYTILRGGKPVATIGPVDTTLPRRTLGELPGLIRDLPRLGPDVESFSEDVAAGVSLQPGLPPVSPWG